MKLNIASEILFLYLISDRVWLFYGERFLTLPHIFDCLLLL